MCLTKNPGSSFEATTTSQDGDSVYGAVYITSGYGVSDLKPVHDYKASCSICETNSSVTITVYGTPECPSGWITEYKGYLMSNYYHSSSSYDRTEFVCVDQHPDTTLGKGSSGEARLYPTEYECGSLPCNVYKENREATCAVCSAPLSNTTGSVYTRWGRTTCPTGTELLYTGYAGSGNAGHRGSGATNMCLTKSPKYLTYNDGNQNPALLYGVQFYQSGIVPEFDAVYKRAMPCSVCYTTAVSNIMYPARTDCPANWKLQYTGYIMSTYYSSRQTDWACVDANPDNLAPGNENSLNIPWYLTEIECGSIWCRNQIGRYIQDRELTCSVCTPDYDKAGVAAPTYVRWGRNECPLDDDTLIYSGFAAGSHNDYSGSGVGVLCMPKVPLYGDYKDGNQNGARLYGFEYETGSNFVGSDMRAVYQAEVPCAVCMNSNTASTFLMYGSDVCPSGYSVDYWGYLFAKHYSQSSKCRQVCIDGSPRQYNNTLGTQNNNQARFYPAEKEGGNLPNPPYTTNTELLCSQCSRRP